MFAFPFLITKLHITVLTCFCHSMHCNEIWMILSHTTSSMFKPCQSQWLHCLSLHQHFQRCRISNAIQIWCCITIANCMYSWKKICDVCVSHWSCIVNATWYLHHTTLPAQKVVLNVTHNNSQLFIFITKYLVDHMEYNQNELLVTSDDPVPVAIRNGEVARRDELHNIHEEADVIIDLKPRTRNGRSYGWPEEEGRLLPVMLPLNVVLVPHEVLHMIRCGWMSTHPCSSANPKLLDYY